MCVFPSHTSGNQEMHPSQVFSQVTGYLDLQTCSVGIGYGSAKLGYLEIPLKA